MRQAQVGLQQLTPLARESLFFNGNYCSPEFRGICLNALAQMGSELNSWNLLARGSLLFDINQRLVSMSSVGFAQFHFNQVGAFSYVLYISNKSTMFKMQPYSDHVVQVMKIKNSLVNIVYKTKLCTLETILV
ncbi:hypothetical protein KP509_07G059200 [Ceratopteris richardii]|uniref:Uncharacterized protein n=1 Tax=Ceratopteris richardii TaxID=49495 RepID=A0A8T2UCQ6_CERRI|nr:hypothetical protein KP509_07G059200 [Ceratopteris richardii]